MSAQYCCPVRYSDTNWHRIDFSAAPTDVDFDCSDTLNQAPCPRTNAPSLFQTYLLIPDLPWAVFLCPNTRAQFWIWNIEQSITFLIPKILSYQFYAKGKTTVSLNICQVHSFGIWSKDSGVTTIKADSNFRHLYYFFYKNFYLHSYYIYNKSCPFIGLHDL